MKSIKTIAVLGALGVSLLGVRAQAQTGTGTTQGNRDRPGNTVRERVKLPERPKIQLPDDLKAMIEAARQAAVDFRAQQAELIKQLKDATAEERAALREQLKENREAFREAQKEREKEIRARLQELREQFKNQRDQVLEAAKEQGKKGRGR